MPPRACGACSAFLLKLHRSASFRRTRNACPSRRTWREIHTPGDSWRRGLVRNPPPEKISFVLQQYENYFFRISIHEKYFFLFPVYTKIFLFRIGPLSEKYFFVCPSIETISFVLIDQYENYVFVFRCTKNIFSYLHLMFLRRQHAAHGRWPRVLHPLRS